jgi:hypothetical protein
MDVCFIHEGGISNMCAHELAHSYLDMIQDRCLWLPNSPHENEGIAVMVGMG